MNYEDLSPEEQLHVENELLKIKLQVETNAMLYCSEEKLPPEIENAWLNNVYNFEKNYQETKLVSVYEYIGNPEYRKLSELLSEEVGATLDSLLDLMFSKGIAFMFMPSCYPPEVLYRFVTEELFPYEGRFPDMQGEGGKWVFHYEDFYPNHRFDLWRYASDFMELLFTGKEWVSEHLQYSHHANIELNQKKITREEYSASIIRFKEKYSHVLFSNPDIGEIAFDLETGKAEVCCTIEMPKENIEFKIQFIKDYDWWGISGLELSLVE